MSDLQRTESNLLNFSPARHHVIENNIILCKSLTEQAIPHENEKYISALHHPLGELVVSTCKIINQIPWRFCTEQSILDSQISSLLASLASQNADNFIAELLLISALVRNIPKAEIRKESVRLENDKNGWYWQFPDAHGIYKCLTMLHYSLHHRVFKNMILEATIAYVILNWMHPFLDGNGRTSRIIFNALLRRLGMSSEIYIPIKEINYLAKGGHEVRLRYTILTGDWDELTMYFINAINFHGKLLHLERNEIDAGDGSAQAGDD